MLKGLYIALNSCKLKKSRKKAMLTFGVKSSLMSILLLEMHQEKQDKLLAKHRTAISDPKEKCK